ncbi:hypothetical protein [Stenotrophomonas maltophilia]
MGTWITRSQGIEKSHIIKEQIAYALLWTVAGDVCRKISVAKAAFCVRRKECRGPDAFELKRL